MTPTPPDASPGTAPSTGPGVTSARPAAGIASALRNGARFITRGPGRAALPGLAGVVLLVVGGLGSGALRRDDPLLDAVALSWLRYGHGKVLTGVLVYAGLLLMFWSWVRIGRAVRAGRVSARQVGGLTVLWTAPLLVSVPLFSRDAYAYLAQGALLRDGFDPYAVGPSVNPGPLLDNVSTVWTTTTTPYGPLFVLIERGVTTLTGDDVVGGTLVLRLVMLPGLALLLWSVPRIARHLGGDPATALWIAALNPLVLVHLIGGVHNEMLMVPLITAGVLAVIGRRHLTGVALISLAVAIKFTAAVALPFMVWIWMRHRRDDAAAGGEQPEGFARGFARTAPPAVAVFSAVFGAATLAAGIGVGWMTMLSSADKIINWLSLPTAVAQIYTVATSWLTGVPLDPVLQTTRLIGEAALAVIVVALIVRHRHSVRGALYGTVLAMAAVLILSPATLPWYYTWPLALIAAFPLTQRACGRIIAFSVFMMLIFRPDGSIGMYQWYQLLFAAACAVAAARTYRGAGLPSLRLRPGRRRQPAAEGR